LERQKVSAQVRFFDFAGRLADFGAIFDPIGFRMGFQKSTIFQKKKISKRRSKKRLKKNMIG
jgi:hypothetical protein